MLKVFIFALTLMVLSGTVLSVPPAARLAISGSITPPTCTLNSQTEETYFYYFDISPGIFPANDNLTLKPQTQNIEVICDATTYLTFISTDERAGSELITGNNYYGLGLYNTDTKIGHFTMTIANATVKTTPDASAISVGIIRGSYFGNTSSINKTNNIGWGVSMGQLAAAQIFAADFTVTPTINNTMKNSAGDAELDGSVLLTFVFGL